MRAVAVAGNRQQAFWLLHLLLHAVVTLMLSARPADLPSRPRTWRGTALQASGASAGAGCRRRRAGGPSDVGSIHDWLIAVR
jgi:hypothetical protein